MFIDVKEFKLGNRFMGKGFYQVEDVVYFVDSSEIPKVGESYAEKCGLFNNEDVVLESNAIRLTDGTIGLLSVLVDKDSDLLEPKDFMFFEGDFESEKYQEYMFKEMVAYLEEEEDFQFSIGDDFLNKLTEEADLMYNPYVFQEDGIVRMEYAEGLFADYQLNINPYNGLVAKGTLYLYEKKIKDLDELYLGMVETDEYDSDEEFFDCHDFSEHILYMLS